MNIEITQATNKKPWLAITACIGLFGYALYALATPNTLTLSRSQLQLVKVEQGPLTVYTQSFGELISSNERLLTAPAGGTVSEIVLRPGSEVTPESVILRLTNPDLTQQLQQAKSQLAQHQARLAALKFEQHKGRLDFQSAIADIEAEAEQAELELTVNQELSQIGIVAGIKLKRAELKLKQLNKKLQFERQKYQQYLEMQNHQLTQSELTVSQQQALVNLYQTRQEGMAVKAGMNGTLQSLEIALGQSVQSGASLAKVGSLTTLMAKLRIPQRKADRVKLNAEVRIDTGKGRIFGRISRIETVVNDGVVLAEAVLESELTDNARPALPVNAQVLLESSNNSRFIKQFPGARPNSSQTAWVLTPDNILSQKTITFGDLTQDKLVISKGLNAGAMVVANSQKRFADFDRIEINNK